MFLAFVYFNGASIMLLKLSNVIASFLDDQFADHSGFLLRIIFHLWVIHFNRNNFDWCPKTKCTCWLTSSLVNSDFWVTFSVPVRSEWQRRSAKIKSQKLKTHKIKQNQRIKCTQNQKHSIMAGVFVSSYNKFERTKAKTTNRNSAWRENGQEMHQHDNITATSMEKCIEWQK